MKAASEYFEESNAQLSRLLHEFARDAEHQRVKRKEAFAETTQETESEIEELKKKILQFASVNV